ncbi:protein kintoun [Protopterus annectens]|uniref:protein kintoun n=1 Tax=Protopterus annectens TaxID=7888 RepID=UPI001CF9ABB2|nr:protein kintoun [Protopterus annectens]
MATSNLEDLNLTPEEVERFSKAFKDKKFRDLLFEYAEEISNPENKKRYEEEITLMEKERGMDIKFVHPQPGYVLKTSLNGESKCFINVCSNNLIAKPFCKPGRGNGGGFGQHWSLPYSLAPGREDMNKEGTKYMIYDVVFHEDTLHMANKNTEFKKMVDSTALEVIQKQYNVKLDEINLKTLKTKYKGVPHASVIRKPLPGEPEQMEDDLSGLQFPYPYDTPKANTSEHKRTSSPKPKVSPVSKEEKQRSTIPCKPKYSIKYRSFVDLQDYTYARDATPSTRPKELLITIDLPLLKSAGQATLDVTETHLTLDSQDPAYLLNITLPYPVDESGGSAKFLKNKKQLVVTLPVLPLKQKAVVLPENQKMLVREDETFCSETDADVSDCMPEKCIESIELDDDNTKRPLVSEISFQESNLDTKEGIETQGSSHVVPDSLERHRNQHTDISDILSSNKADIQTELSDSTNTCHLLCSNALLVTHKGTLKENKSSPISEGDSTQFGHCFETQLPQNTNEGSELCPSFKCMQDDKSFTLFFYVKHILQDSFKITINMGDCTANFRTDYPPACYSLVIHFTPGNNLVTDQVTLNINNDHTVIILNKAPKSFGLWKKLHFGTKSDCLLEKVLMEETADAFSENALSSCFPEKSPCQHVQGSEAPNISESDLQVTTEEKVLIMEEMADAFSENALSSCFPEKPPFQHVQSSEKPNISESDLQVTSEDEHAFTQLVQEGQLSFARTDTPMVDMKINPTENNTPLGYVLDPCAASLSMQNTTCPESVAKKETAKKTPCPGDTEDLPLIKSEPTASCLSILGIQTDSRVSDLDEKNDGNVESEIIKSKVANYFKQNTEASKCGEDANPEQQQLDKNNIFSQKVIPPVLTEVKDGDTKVICNHETHSAVTFYNSLLFELD